ncbi:hypothetical protein K4F52_003271 [Lecanicillium sp. MT-2017a]|nr:hypothetical protein K4F52_003271 [Lecanicillium sp. MT-2017a]
MADHDRRHDGRGSGSDDDHSDTERGRRKTTNTSTTITAAQATESGRSDTAGGYSSSSGSVDCTPPDGGDSGEPRFLQDQRRTNNKWPKWVPYPIQRTGRAIAKWTHGPPNAAPYRIKPWLPKIQEYPLRLMDRFFPRRRQRQWLLFLLLSLWVVTFALVKWRGTRSTDIKEFGQPTSLTCGAQFWTRSNHCGVDGNDCRPFNGTSLAFTCPANCASYKVLNPRAVGDQEVIYRPLIVGGPSSDLEPGLSTYRGDSYICGAAIHAGIITNGNGGCGVLKLIGRQQDFVSSQRNGITSVGFNSYFPLSYQFVPDIECTASDSRWRLLAVSTAFSLALCLFTSSPAAFFFPTFVGLFATVGLATDPPSSTTIAGLVSNILGKLLPAMFCAWVMYDKIGVRRTLTGLTAQIEKSVLWLGACWVGALDNYTLDFIPIQRLTGHDLAQQPGAKAALSIIVIALFVIVCFQVYFFRQEARFIKYIKLYALFVGGIVIALLLPDLNLRIHHYILALLLLPGTSIQTRPSLLYQGLLVGLFINGIARWGFDSVLQTSGALQGDAQKGTLLPTVHTPSINWANSTDATSNITFTWDLPGTRNASDKATYDGISVLVNDVERFRAYFDDTGSPGRQYVWSRNTSLDLPEYFRFGFMTGSTSGDYTKAGVWTADGEWKEMAPGPSK